MKTSISRTVVFIFGVALAVGGSGFLLRAEPPQAVNTWASTGGTAQPAVRTGAATVTLDDGSVLIAAGLGLDGLPTDSVVIYNPVTNDSASVGQLLAARVNASAALLEDGRVLVTGGNVGDVISADAEVFDPFTGASTLAMSGMAQPRTRHASARLADGKVLIVGGATLGGAALATAELFDPETGNISATGNMAVARTGASATILIDGRVLVAGGNDGTQDLASAEIYYSYGGTFSNVETPLSVARAGHTAVLLPHNNSVLIAGGTALNEAGTARVPVATTDLFLPAMFPDPYSWSMGTFAVTDAMDHARSQAVGGPAGDNGYAFVVGGGSPQGEAYRFATIKTDKDDYAPGQPAVITGSGWQANETLTLVFQEDPAVHPDYAVTVETDDEGNFDYRDWAPEGHDLGVRFYLMATGSQSRAQTTFTDSRQVTAVITPTTATVGTAVTYTVTVTNTSAPSETIDSLEIAIPLGAGAPSALSVVANDPGPTVRTWSVPTVVGSTIRTSRSGGSLNGIDQNGTIAVTFTATATTSGTKTWAVTPWSNNNYTGNNFPIQSGFSQPSVTVSAAGPTKLAFTSSAFTGVVNQCLGPVQTQTQDASNVATNVTSNTTVNLATDGGTSGAGTFFSDNACATGISSVSISSGSNSASFYYKATARGDGTHELTVSAAGLTNASQTQTINNADQAAVTITAPPSATYAQTGLSVSGGGGSGAGAFSYSHGASTACTVDSTTGALTITSGTGTCSVTATKAADSNYNVASSAPAAIVINKAVATVTVTGYTGTYDAAAHGATGSATGVDAGGAALGSTLTLGASFTNVPGGTANWTFTGGTNYTDQNGTAAIVINKAVATVTVTGYTGTYDAAAHGASGTVLGVTGDPTATGSTLTLGASFTNVPGGTANWTFTGGTNYTDQNGTAAIVINKAVATVTVTGYTGTYDAAAHGASGTVLGVAGDPTAAGSSLNLGASFTNVPGGTANWTFTGGTNYTDQNGTAAIVINKAVATVTVTGYTGTYDAAAHGASGTVLGVAGDLTAAGSTLTLGASFTNVPGGTANWTFAGGTNYTNQNGTAAIVINKAVATVTVTGYTGTYDAAAHGASGTVLGVVGDLTAAGSTLTLGASFTNVPGGTANWTFAGGTNYTDQNGTAAIVINKAVATVTVTGYTGTYDAAAHGASGTVLGVTGDSTATGSSLTLGASFTNVPGGTANWTFTGGTNYTDQNGTAAIVINKAVATVTVTGYTGTYDAAAHGASGTVLGVTGDPTATGSTLTLGASFTNVPGGTANWTFAGGTNYTDQNGTAAIVINKAVATVTVTGYTGTYDAAAHGASGTVLGVAGDPTAAGSTLTLGASFTNVPGGTANWTFAGGTNYTDQNGTAAIAINKAVATVTVTGYTGTYDAAAHGASGTVLGVVGDPTATGSSLNLGASFTNVPGGTANWTFTGGTNYTDQSGTAAIVINKAVATVTVTGYTGTYDAAAHGASGTVLGVTGDPTATGSSLTLGASFTNVPGGTANWTFTGGTNYTDQNGTAAIVINKAVATVTVTGYTGTYDAAAHGASGTVLGVTGDPTATGSTLTLGASFTNVPGGTANWTFTGGTNYTDQNGTAAIVINKAVATVTVTGYTGTYDAAAHGASGTVLGVAGDPTATGSSLNLGASFTNVPGGTANWTFTGGTNYTDQNGTAAIVINKAVATVTVTGYTGTYDAAAHGASGTVLGVAGDLTAAGSTLTLGASFTNVPGGTANWTFAGGTNYTDQNGTAAIVINKAVATVTVTGYTGTYDAAAHGASDTVLGVAGDLTATGSTLTLGASFTNVPGGTANWTFAGGTNYTDQNGTAAIVINKAVATVTVTGYTGTYDAAAHGASGTVLGVAGDLTAAGSTLTLGASFTNVPGGTANWTFTGGTNYTDQNGTAAIVISKAAATVTVSGYTGVYDAAAHGATATIVGVAGDVTAAGSSFNSGAFTNVPGGTANWTFTGGTNYNDQSGTAAIVINKADATVTVSGYTGVYDAAGHGATATIVGVAGDVTAAGSSFNSGTFTNVPGGTANWTFTGGTNYNNQSGTATITISQADATVTVSGYTGTYDAAAHGATVTIVGVAGDLSAAGSSFNAGASFTNVPGGAANWTFEGGANYLDESGTAAITINQADASVSITPYSGTYDAVAHNLSGTVTGVAGDLAAAGSSLTFGTGFTNAPGGLGSWTFEGGANYLDESGTAAIVINKAVATVTVTGYTGTYNALAHGATGTVVGVDAGGAALGSTLALGASFTNVPGGTANWTFTGGTNYTNQSGTAAIVINKANAVINVTPYNVVFDSNPHTATGTVTGVLSESLSGLVLSGTTHTSVGVYATDPWTFTDVTGNYNNTVGTVSDSIGAWTKTGFYQPVDMSTSSTIVWNTVKNGSTVPLKFNLFAGSTEKTSPSDIQSFGLNTLLVASLSCSAGVEEAVEEFTTTGATTLRYSGTPGSGGQFIQNWQTPKTPNKCFRTTMTALDGSTIIAYFKLK